MNLKTFCKNEGGKLVPMPHFDICIFPRYEGHRRLPVFDGAAILGERAIGELFYFDDRLAEFRNVKNSHDRVDTMDSFFFANLVRDAEAEARL